MNPDPQQRLAGWVWRAGFGSGGSGFIPTLFERLIKSVRMNPDPQQQ
jgi:hypothetical protein